MPSRMMAFPVRFAADGETVQTTTRELSELGVFVRCVDPPREGTRVSLRLYLPRGERIDVEGMINQSVASGSDTGFWAKFVRPHAGAVERIEAALAGGPALVDEPAVKANRRAMPRYLDSFRVSLGGSSEGACRAANVSASGLFIFCDEPPRMESIVHLVLELPDGGPPAKVQAIVVRRVLPGRAKGNLAPGAGVQFIGADDDFRRRFDEYLKER